MLESMLSFGGLAGMMRTLRTLRSAPSATSGNPLKLLRDTPRSAHGCMELPTTFTWIGDARRAALNHDLTNGGACAPTLALGRMRPQRKPICRRPSTLSWTVSRSEENTSELQ